jgi:Rap1a immunity proteins
MSPFRSALIAACLCIFCGADPLAAPSLPDSSSRASESTAALPNDSQQFLALITTYRGKAFCAPSTATIGDAIKVVAQSVKSHPEWQGRYSDQQALQALADAYPCTVSPGTPISQLGGRKLLATPGGEYATIDTKADIAIIQQLRAGAATENANLAAQVTRASGHYSPPVLFALAEWYYMRGQIDEALFWLNAAGLRGQFDAKICTDASALSAVAELSQRLPPDLYRQQWQDPARINRIVDRVIDWDAKTPADYDHRWISLHGLKAMNSGLGLSVAPGPLTLPPSQWHDIGEKNRQNYRANMYRYAAGDRRPTI